MAVPERYEEGLMNRLNAYDLERTIDWVNHNLSIEHEKSMREFYTPLVNMIMERAGPELRAKDRSIKELLINEDVDLRYKEDGFYIRGNKVSNLREIANAYSTMQGNELRKFYGRYFGRGNNLPAVPDIPLENIMRLFLRDCDRAVHNVLLASIDFHAEE